MKKGKTKFTPFTVTLSLLFVTYSAFNFFLALSLSFPSSSLLLLLYRSQFNFHSFFLIFCSFISSWVLFIVLLPHRLFHSYLVPFSHSLFSLPPPSVTLCTLDISPCPFALISHLSYFSCNLLFIFIFFFSIVIS